MKTTQLKNLSGVVLLALAGVTASGQAPVIASFGQNGELVCTNLQPGSTASVEWASSVLGPWTNNWAGLDAVTADSNGAIRVSVPMFYRVRCVAANPFLVPTNMALIPAGPFTMGDTFNDWPPEWEANPEIPVHTVDVSAFYMDRYEVTKALWDEVYTWATNRGYSFDYGADGKAANHPAHSMTWYEAVKWCNARSEKENRTPAYYTSAAQTTVYRAGEVDVQNDWVNWTAGYRLPTEAEWEKAARGGASGRRFPWVDADTIAHSRANYYSYWGSGHPYYPYDLSATAGHHPSFQAGGEPYTSPVGYFASNGYGLYDMAGNVWEWCWDWYGSYSSGSQNDPRGPTTGSHRVIRGGGWGSSAIYCRSAGRNILWPDYGDDGLGFRSVLPPGQP